MQNKEKELLNFRIPTGNKAEFHCKSKSIGMSSTIVLNLFVNKFNENPKKVLGFLTAS